jgi:hypothetical protein
MLVLEFLRSPWGTGVVLVAAGIVLAGLSVWARAREHPERRLLLSVAGAVTAVLAGVYVLAVAGGWWTGEYFLLPAHLQAAILLPTTLAGCTLWLAGYGWVAERTPRALWVLAAITLLIVAAVAIAHLLNLGQGTILVGPGWTIVYDAIVGLAVLWAPVLVYEALRQALRHAELLP